MLEGLKIKFPLFFNTLGLILSGAGLGIAAFLGAAAVSIAGFIIGPIFSARMVWQFMLPNEPILKRVLLTGLAPIGLFIAYAITFPFLVLGLAIISFIWPVAGAYLAASKGWENLAYYGGKARDYLSII
jgi:hypothetical protein